MYRNIIAGEFSYFSAPINNVTPKNSCDLKEMKEILVQTNQEKTNLLRCMDKKDASDFKKKNFDYVTFSGTFGKRSDYEIVSHSNLICIDIDDIENATELKQRLSNDPYVALIFISPSGTGIKLVFGMDNNYSQQEWYKAISKYLGTTYKIEMSAIDSSCSNVSRACFIPCDKEPYLKEGWELGIPLIDTCYFEEEDNKSNVENSETSYDSYETCDSEDSDLGELSFSERNSEENFRRLFARNVRFVGDFRSPRQTWIHKLACRCNKFGMSEDVTIQYLRKYLEFHPASIDPKKPMNVEDYIVKTAKDVYRRYADDFGTQKPVLNQREYSFCNETISEGMYKKLPPILSEITNSFSGHEKDLVFLSALSVLSAVLPGVYGVYDRQSVHPNIMTFVTANAASGKGRAVFGRKLGSSIEAFLREEYSNALAVYNSNLKLYEKEQLDKKPVPPKKKLLFLPANSSSAAFYNALNNNQDGAVIFETEADTLLTALRNDWGSFSDLLRKAFHNEPASFLRVAEENSGVIEKTNISVFLAGTPNQFYNMFPDVENGLLSRFLIYSFNSSSKWKNVFEVNDDDTEALIEKLSADVKRLFQICSAKKSVIPKFQFTNTQIDEFTNFFSSVNDQYLITHGSTMLASIKRLGISMFKIAMILSAIRHAEEINENKWDGICRNADFEASLLLIKSLLPHIDKIWKSLPKNGTNGSRVNVQMMNYYNNLPNTFNKKLAEGVAKAIKLNLHTAEKFRYRLEEHKLVEKLGHNQYKKVA